MWKEKNISQEISGNIYKLFMSYSILNLLYSVTDIDFYALLISM